MIKTVSDAGYKFYPRMGSVEDRRGGRRERPGLYPPPFLGPALSTDILGHQVSHLYLFVSRTSLVQIFSPVRDIKQPPTHSDGDHSWRVTNVTFF